MSTIVEMRSSGVVFTYTVEYRPMTNEEIYEAQIRSDNGRRKRPVVKSVKIECPSPISGS